MEDRGNEEREVGDRRWRTEGGRQSRVDDIVGWRTEG